jgi:hypothetical protein
MAGKASDHRKNALSPVASHKDVNNRWTRIRTSTVTIALKRIGCHAAKGVTMTRVHRHCFLPGRVQKEGFGMSSGPSPGNFLGQERALNP